MKIKLVSSLLFVPDVKGIDYYFEQLEYRESSEKWFQIVIYSSCIHFIAFSYLTIMTENLIPDKINESRNGKPDRKQRLRSACLSAQSGQSSLGGSYCQICFMGTANTSITLRECICWSKS